MRALVYILLFTLFLSPVYCAENSTRWNVYFAPQDRCTDAIVEALNKAKSTILVQAYSFTSVPIARALVEAHKRGVKIEVILDKSQRTEKYSSATFLLNNGIQPLIDASHAIAHNKVMVIDMRTVITGSFNFTKAAEESNAENVLIVHDLDVADKYMENWIHHKNHSKPYMSPLSGNEKSKSKSRKN